MSSRRLKIAGLAALVIVFLLFPLVVKGPYYLSIVILAGMAVVLSVSLRTIFNTGLLSLGHGGMMSIGAYTSALLVMKLGFSSWATLWLGGIAAAVVAVLVGYPFVRLKGMYFSLVTVFFSEIIRLIAEQWRGMTGGTFGLTNIPHPDAIIIGPLNLDFSSKTDFYYLILALGLFTIFVLYAIERSSITRTWLSIRQTDTLAESVGVNTARYKVIAFAAGSFFAGLTGAFYAHYVTVVTPSGFGFVYAVYVVVYMMVGGINRFSGPIIGAVLLTLLPESVQALKEYEPYLFAAVLILIVFFLPGGLVSLPQRVKTLFGGRA
jgi:branched-chain amino acid transport system permease protein